jgi:hypothetical protein
VVCQALIPNEDNRMSTLNTLVLRDCRIGSSLEQCELLAHALSRNFALKVLDLSSNRIDEAGARVLAKGILENKALSSLILAGRLGQPAWPACDLSVRCCREPVAPLGGH